MQVIVGSFKKKMQVIVARCLVTAVDYFNFRIDIQHASLHFPQNLLGERKLKVSTVYTWMDYLDLFHTNVLKA